MLLKLLKKPEVLADEVAPLDARRTPPAEGAVAPPLHGATMQLRHVQAWALQELAEVRGGVIAAGVGHGKTLIAYGCPEVLRVAPHETLVMLPANLRETFRREGAKYASEFNTPAELPVLSYEQLSRPDSVELLTDLAPKLIICDEAHHLANKDSARTGRFLRYLDDHPETMLVIMSGTLISRDVMDVAHLVRRAIGNASPFPQNWSSAQALGRCINPNVRGDQFASLEDWNITARWLGLDLKPLRRVSQRVQAAREAMHQRIINTRGIVHTTSASCDASIYVQPITAPESQLIEEHLEHLYQAWELPDGTWLNDELRVGAAATHLALGFYNKPRSEAPREWLDARAVYASELRCFIKFKGGKRKGFDSPGRVKVGLETGAIRDADLLAAWEAWRAVEDQYEHVTDPLVITTDVIGHALGEVQARTEGAPLLVWYSTLGEAEILQRLGVPICWPGDEPKWQRGALGVSIRSHGTGKQLQAWQHQLVLSPPASGLIWEQLIGRTHRLGQQADEVWVYVLLHTQKAHTALKAAREDASFSEALQGQPTKLELATFLP